jgi:hypothetical protein
MLAEMLDRLKVIHVRGTPTSGKTTLAHLLREHYLDKQEPVVFIRIWSASGNAASYLIKEREENGFGRIHPHEFYSQSVVFIIDEAQWSYSDTDFWGGILKSISIGSSQVRICLFSSYGSPSSGVDELPGYITPLEFGFEQRISITISQHRMAPKISLFYTREEFDDVVRRICSRKTEPFALESSATEYLFALTSGHPGAVDGLLYHIYEVCRNFNKSYSII